MKNNGREYLLEHAKDQPNWLKCLIYEVIDSNGDISQKKVEDILESLLYDDEIEIDDCKCEATIISNKIILTELNHKEGVNALADNQVIKFCDEVNILYGMNGTGKSSYFRILNEIVGGNQKKEILSNINENQCNQVNVDISYKNNDKLKEINGWDANSRSFPVLNNCMVYDTSYQDSLLNTRESNTTLVEPLGLHLFSYIIEILDSMKDTVDAKVEMLNTEKPYINTEDFSDSVKNVFTNETFNKEIRDNIVRNLVFSDDEVEKLKKIEDDITSLKQSNLDDKIKLYRNKEEGLNLLIDSIDSISQKLENNIDSVGTLTAIYIEKKKENKVAQNSYQALRNIPKSDTSEWKEFINAGSKYNDVFEELEDNICPYCRQELRTEESIQITEAFSSFLKNRTQFEFDDIVKKINRKIKDIEGVITDISIQNNIASVLKENIIDSETVFDKINSIIKSFDMTKRDLLNVLKSHRLDDEIKVYETSEVIRKIEDIRVNISGHINRYSEKDEDKNKKIKKLIFKSKTLKEKKSMYLQKEKIKKWFDLSNHIKRLNNKKLKLSTRSLSLISKKAHENLLTESLQESFSDELNKIGFSNLDVQLKGEKTQKGISSTKLVIKNLDNVQMILSEGEQRAIALALFIAEIRLQKDINPIILDDPVNSLDHKIASKFAERLLKLENQVILFVHNRLFLDAFESSKAGHVCKTIDSDCNSNKGKHIRIYEVISHGKNQKGVLRKYKGSKLKDKIREIEKNLNKTPFEEDVKVANLIRLAIESTVDEIIFNHQVPTRFSNKNSRIQWDELKKLNSDDSLIEELKEIHSRVSGGCMHNGNESMENPIELEEYRNITSKIKGFIEL